jgi:hypothetical protein
MGPSQSYAFMPQVHTDIRSINEAEEVQNGYSRDDVKVDLETESCFCRLVKNECGGSDPSHKAELAELMLGLPATLPWHGIERSLTVLTKHRRLPQTSPQLLE